MQRRARPSVNNQAISPGRKRGEELLDLPNVVLTPHLGSATRQTREAMTRLAVDNVLAVERGDPPLTPVLPNRA